MRNVISETPNRTNGVSRNFNTKDQSSQNSSEKLSNSAGERLGAMASEISTTSAEYVKSGRDYISENPVKGVAMASAAGVVVGSLLTMILRRSKPQ